jgi:hypothetical protein
MNDFGPSFWSGIIYIILVAMIMTVFELGFFAFVAGPSETNEANAYLQKLSKNLSKTSKTQTLAQVQAKQQLIDVLNVSVIREDILNKKINNDAITFICLEIFILILFIVIFWNILQTSVSKNTLYANQWNSYKGIQPALFSAFIACGVIIGFQGSMYNFGRNFSYSTNNELQYKIVTKLKTDLNIPDLPNVPTTPKV